MSTAARLRRALPVVLTVVFLVVAVVVVRGASGQDGAPPPVTPIPDSVAPAPPSPCGPPPAGGRSPVDGVLTIGTIVPLTGRELDATGPALTAATEMAVRDVSAAGGVPGLGLAPLGPGTQRDSGVPGSGATCAAATALLTAGTDAVVGPSASVDSSAAYPALTGAGRVMVSPASTLSALSDAPDGGLFFRTASSNDVQGGALAALVAEDGNRNVAVVTSTEPYATDLSDSIVEDLKGRSVPTTVLTYDPEAPRFNDIAGQLAGAPYDGIVFVGFTEVAGLVNNLLSRGVTPANRKMYGSEGFLFNTFAQQASPGAPGRLAGFRGFVPWADPGFNERLKAFRGGLADLTHGAQAYDAVIAVSLAAAAAGTDDPARIATQLPQVTRGGQKCADYAACVALLRQNPATDIDYDGASGPLGFTPQGDPCQVVYLLSAFDDASGLQALGLRYSADRCA
ncbi:ABC transporter substrate-binding protein [Actinomycetospora termitidis]|uniref:ABC transporter substrate-binding protein n=1 Tax=Actinomycetospora termitidis TaxID=3053470 RepID=A0ABT7MBN8_9PSEU|nr:ABC transporter substrate-binding protein [Actinomycetospora sp. Odt1-22]MDL5158080.1 ABC transporter substrate-binding protein [Actinomycetospora sp. Odt1-22]